VIPLCALFDTVVRSHVSSRGNISIFKKKQGLIQVAEAPRLKRQKIRPGDAPGLILRKILIVWFSMSEEQPQQDDYRNRHAQEPEQNSSSHPRLLELLDRGRNAGTSGKVPADRRDEDFGTGGHTIQRARFLVPPCG
jgi:hypothetical protein